MEFNDRRTSHEESRTGTAKAKPSAGDNPKWKCENCGNKGAMDYAGQGRVCKSCAKGLGF